MRMWGVEVAAIIITMLFILLFSLAGGIATYVFAEELRVPNATATIVRQPEPPWATYEQFSKLFLRVGKLERQVEELKREKVE